MKTTSVLFLLAALITGCGNAGREASVARGQQVFSEHCVACHSVSSGVIIVGPSLAGVANRVAAGGEDPTDFLRQAILNPQAEITEGFPDLMPPDFEQKISEQNLDALISYLLTLE